MKFFLRKNQSLNIKIQELEIKFANSLTLEEENKSTLGMTSNDSKNLSDSPVGCYLCKNKIMKNYVGFSIHFSRMHKVILIFFIYDKDIIYLLRSMLMEIDQIIHISSTTRHWKNQN